MDDTVPDGASELATKLLWAIATGGDEGLKAAQNAWARCSLPLWQFVVLQTRIPHTGGTLLHVAASMNRWRIYKLMCDTGANPHAIDGYGQRCSDVAQAQGHICLAVHMVCNYETVRPQHID